MNVKAILVLLASILWFAFSSFWYCCKIRGADCSFCPPQIETPSKSTAAAGTLGALTYRWADATPIPPADFDDYKADLLKKKSDDNILEIVGYYSPEEENTSGSENLGLARADQSRKLFKGDLPEERIRIRGEERKEAAGMRTGTFESTAFNWIVTEVEKTEVIQLSNSVIILFPSNSVIQEKNVSVETYLNKLAATIKQSKQKVAITGHTDNVGEAANNLKLGIERARQIRSILLSKGVLSTQIQIDSRGESEPIATNDSEAGRHQNRRVEVKLID